MFFYFRMFLYFYFFLFFFFQAEDGIRDRTVTGVQTCALPISNTDQDSHGVSSLLVNPYAAVPSMHIAFALMIGVPGAALSRTAWARAWWYAYPLLVLFVIVVTANHFWFDAAAGAAVACLAAITAHQLARVGPESWAWGDAAEEAAPG